MIKTEQDQDTRFAPAVICIILAFTAFFCIMLPVHVSAASAGAITDRYTHSDKMSVTETIYSSRDTTVPATAGEGQTQQNTDTTKTKNTEITDFQSPAQQYPEITGYTSSVSKSSITIPAEGKTYARIRVSGTTLDQPVYYGDSDEILMKGIGTYQYYGIPGEGTTTLICGHCQLYMAPMEQARTGDTVTLDTGYGTYLYQIESIEVKTPQQWESEWNDDAAKARGEYLILYCCYPFGKTSYTKTERIFYNCRFISGGPQLISD